MPVVPPPGPGQSRFSFLMGVFVANAGQMLGRGVPVLPFAVGDLE